MTDGMVPQSQPGPPIFQGDHDGHEGSLSRKGAKGAKKNRLETLRSWRLGASIILSVSFVLFVSFMVNLCHTNPGSTLKNTSASFGFPYRRPEFRGGVRHVDVVDTERSQRVHDRVGHRRGRTVASGFAHTLDTQRVKWVRCHRLSHCERRHISGAR